MNIMPLKKWSIMGRMKDNIADVFTKAGVNTDRVFNVLRNGSLLYRNKTGESKGNGTV